MTPTQWETVFSNRTPWPDQYRILEKELRIFLSMLDPNGAKLTTKQLCEAMFTAPPRIDPTAYSLAIRRIVKLAKMVPGLATKGSAPARGTYGQLPNLWGHVPLDTISLSVLTRPIPPVPTEGVSILTRLTTLEGQIRQLTARLDRLETVSSII